jgi:hypothetical protein
MQKRAIPEKTGPFRCEPDRSCQNLGKWPDCCVFFPENRGFFRKSNL